MTSINPDPNADKEEPKPKEAPLILEETETDPPAPWTESKTAAPTPWEKVTTAAAAPAPWDKASPPGRGPSKQETADHPTEAPAPSDSEPSESLALMEETPKNEALMKAQVQVQALRDAIQKAVIGQEEVIDQVLVALLAGGHVLIEGVPGLGKTLLVRALAKAFKGDHARIQFTPDLMPSDVLGHVMFDMQHSRFKIRRGPIFTHILLADEINRAPAKTQAALLEAMQERQVTLEGRPLALPAPFMTLATQNPVEQEGTYALPEAQLDRFLLKILIDYPEESEEMDVVNAVIDHKVGDNFDLSGVTEVAQDTRILELQQIVAEIRVDQKVMEYAVKLVRTTREWPGILIGAGPRGSIAILRAARGYALLQGRDFVLPDDVKTMAHPALRHRLSVSPDLEIEGKTADHLLTEMLRQVEAPRL